MSVDLKRSTADPADEFLQYRALSSLAVISLAAGLLSGLALFDWFWIVLPISGVLLGVAAWRKVKSRPDELTGLLLAKIGLCSPCCFCLPVPPG